MRRLVRGTAAALILAGALATAFWLGTLATTTTPVTPKPAAPATITARSGTLEAVQPVDVTAEWRPARPLFNRMAGTVTALDLRLGVANEVTAGMTLLHVDGKAVVALAGDTPAYRDIVAGAQGDDVSQVQRFLVAQGELTGAADGVWDQVTADAWKHWRHRHGLSDDNTVTLGQVIFVPGLPGRLAVVDSLAVGQIVTGVEQIGATLAKTPTVSIVLGAGADQGVPARARVSFTVGAADVDAVITDRRSNVDNGVRVDLDLVGGCAAWCDTVATGAAGKWSGTVHLTGPVSGAIIPLGALQSGSGTTSEVILADGTLRTVDVRVTVNGEAVVDGISPGDTIRLPAPVAAVSTSDPP